MMFRKVVGLVEAALFPKDNELALTDTVTNPVEAHVNGFGSFLFNRIVGNAGSGAVVGLDGSGRLSVSFDSSVSLSNINRCVK
jgi:hypothetical protein